MKIRNIVYAVLAVLLAFQMYSIYNLKNTNDKLINKIQDSTSNPQSTFTHIVYLDYLKSIESQSHRISQDIILYDENSNSKKLSQILASGKKFVVRYPQSACMACIEVQVPLIKSLAEEVGVENVIFISSFTNSREIKLIKQRLDINFDVYLNTDLGLPIEEIAEVEMFLLDQNLVPRKIFIPRKEYPDIISKYIDHIKTQI